MTNIPKNPKFANLQTFYKNFPMLPVVVSTVTKSIQYMPPCQLTDMAIDRAKAIITKLQIPMEVVKSQISERTFIVREVAA